MTNILLDRQLTQYKYDDAFTGDITGENINPFDTYDKGMPIRSTFTMKDTTKINEHTDFNLFDKIGSTNIKSVDEYTDLNASTELITKNSDPYETCIYDVNTTTLWLYSTIKQLTKHCTINGVNLFMLFGILYITSKNNNELKNYFGFQDKKYLNAGLMTIYENLSKHRTQFIFDNYILHDISIKANIIKMPFVTNIIIDKTNIDEDARINNIFKTKSGLDKLISMNTLLNISISLISVAKISLIWKYKIDLQTKKYVQFNNKTFDYYDNKQLQIIEIPLYNTHYIIGYINSQEQIDLKILTTAINYMKPTVMNNVLIPIHKQRNKIRLNKTLTQTGITLFTHIHTNTLYPKLKLSDYLQYVDIDISTRSANINCINKGIKTTINFMCKNSFEFYIRDTNTNMIMLICSI